MPVVLVARLAVADGMLYNTQFHLVVLLSGCVVISSTNAVVPDGALVQANGGVDLAPSQV